MIPSGRVWRRSEVIHFSEIIWGDPVSTFAKFSEKLIFLTLLIRHVPHLRVRFKGLEMLVFRKVLRTYLMNDPFASDILDLGSISNSIPFEWTIFVDKGGRMSVQSQFFNFLSIKVTSWSITWISGQLVTVNLNLFLSSHEMEVVEDSIKVRLFYRWSLN